MDNIDTQPMFGDAVSTTDTPRLTRQDLRKQRQLGTDTRA